MTANNTNKFNYTYLQSLDKRLRELRRELEEELGMYRDDLINKSGWVVNKREEE